MAVQSDTSRIQYAGNNSTTTSYAVPFVFQENSHLKAIARTSAGVESVVTLTNHTGAGDVNGGTVRTAVAVPATSTLTIYREVPATQTTTYAEGGDFPAASHERALDKLTQIAQQLDRKVGSAIRLSAATQLPDLNPPATNQQHILSSVGGAAPSWQALPSLSIGPVIATGSTAARSVQDRFADNLNVNDFGADSSGATASNAAVTAMAAAVGRVVFSAGEYLLNDITIDVPVYYEEGAYTVAANGQTVTIRNSITSPKQYIFRKNGTGAYSLTQDTTTGNGENVRHVHVSWFGATTKGQLGADQAPFIQAACDAVGNFRESTIEFEIGNYNMLSSVSVSRCCHILGMGTRRTVFKVSGDGYPVFQTNNVGVKFSGIQFELHNDTPTRNSEFILLQHEGCGAEDIGITNSALGVVVDGLNCGVNGIGGLWTTSYGAGSCAVLVKQGGAVIRNVNFSSVTKGPEALVNIGRGATATVSNVIISGIQYTTACTGLLIDANNVAITRCYVEGFIYNGFGSGNNPDNAIVLKTTGSGTINSVVIESGVISSHATNGIKLQQDSAGEIRGIAINNVVIQGSTGIGIEMARTAGVLADISLGAGTNIFERATPIAVSGTTDNIKIDPNSYPNGKNAIVLDYNLLDDTAVTIDLHRAVFTGFLLVTAGSANFGMYCFRAANSPSITTIQQSAAMNPVTAVLNGTSGSDGTFNIGVQNAVLYLENRTGATQRCSVTILSGV